MVFSSPTFLFLFLPLVIACAWLAGQRLRNAVLCGASLLFYAWGEPVYVLLMLVSIVMNYGFGRAIGSRTGKHHPRAWLAAGVAANLLLLGHYKYADFLVTNLNRLLDILGHGPLPLPDVTLPIGISFFTFQAISYLVDVHRREVPVERSLLNVALYISMFPQLIAGPIVRYSDVAQQIRQRHVTMAGFAQGVQRFAIGLAKKMLLANPAGIIANAAFGAAPGTLTAGFAWLGLVCYAVQIYFDFSGYSDMAIGLGRMFGFTYPENFRHPYCANSLREFWRRWHISLSTWFRDYLYLPLGGNRLGTARTCLNLLVVFTLCGLWHGASWNFLLWGWWHGLFLAVERAGLGRLLARLPALVAHLYTLLVVCIGWVPFRAGDSAATLDYLRALGGTDLAVPAAHAGYPTAVLLAVAGVAATPLGAQLASAATGLARSPAAAAALALTRLCLLAAALVGSAALVAADTYNPFIYFRF